MSKSTRTVQPIPGRDQSRRVLVFAASPVQVLDVVGPMEVFAVANRLVGGRVPAYQVELVAAGPGPVITACFGLQLGAAAICPPVRGRIDTLLVAGGEGARTLKQKPVIKWLRATARRARRVGSVCTGAFLLAETGLLDGRRATTHWAWAADLAHGRPEVKVDANPIWIRDGRYYTSAGVTAGMDLALELVAEDLGRPLALRVARELVLFLHRPGNQAQFSVSLAAQLSGTGRFQSLRAWMIENLAGDLSIEALARHTGMSPRHFCRTFLKAFGMGPGRYVNQLRIEAARRELEQTNHGLKEIAAACGLGSCENLRQAFWRELAATPGSYRKRFQVA